MADGVITRQFNTATGQLVSGGGRTGYYTEDNLPDNYVASVIDPAAPAA